MRFHPGLARKPPKGGPREGLWDSRGLSGSREPLPGGFLAPRGLRVGASHRAELGAPAEPRCSAALGLCADLGRGGGGRRRKGGAERWAGGEGSPAPVRATVKAGERRLLPTSPPVAGPGLLCDPGAQRDAERPALAREARGYWRASGSGRPLSKRGKPSAEEGNRWRGPEAFVRPGSRWKDVESGQLGWG